LDQLCAIFVLQLLAQMGVEHCYTWLQPEQLTAAFIRSLRKRLAGFGLTLWNAGCMKVHGRGLHAPPFGLTPLCVL
jgi:hypothetical protein